MTSSTMKNTCDILITNAKGVVIPEIGIIQTNILIENGKIKSLQRSIDNIQASKTISANDKVRAPRCDRPTCSLRCI